MRSIQWPCRGSADRSNAALSVVGAQSAINFVSVSVNDPFFGKAGDNRFLYRPACRCRPRECCYTRVVLTVTLNFSFAEFLPRTRDILPTTFTPAPAQCERYPL
jgi:hypothetical protein